MVTPKYDPSVDFSDENLSQTLLALLAGGDRKVLDVGCATGYLATMLRSRGCQVDGIEYDPVMAERAAPHVDRIEVGDVQAMDLPAMFGPASYDVVVFGDVLEHLTEPQRVLQSSLPLLKPGGAIVASIPNVAHGAVRLQLLQGRFDYTSTGLLDETHVRFFTRETVLAMIEAAGLAVVDVREESLRTVFYDVGAVVHFLRKVVWIVPDFTVDRYRQRLAELHDRIQLEGSFVAHAQRFLIEAQKTGN